MNKFIIIIILVLLTGLFASNYLFKSDELINGVGNNTAIDGSTNSDFEAIQPLVFNKSEQSGDQTKPIDANTIYFRKTRDENQPEEEINSEEVLKNLGKNYMTLGEILARPISKEHVVENLVEDIKRAKYNLKISKQMAAMTTDIYYLDENGERQINQETMDKIHELRKKLIVQVNFDRLNTGNK